MISSNLPHAALYDQLRQFYITLHFIFKEVFCRLKGETCVFNFGIYSWNMYKIKKQVKNRYSNTQYRNFGHFLVDSFLSRESNSKYGPKKIKM